MNLIKKTNQNNIFATEFTDTGWFLVIFLSLAICALFERLIYDLGRMYGESTYSLPYFQDSKTISIHALIIILFLIVSLSLNYFLAEKKSKYAIILIPYFIVSCILAVQLALQTSVYFYNNHTSFQFYLAMGILAFVLTYGMYYIQDNLRRKNNNLPAPALKTLPIAIFIILVGFVLLTLVFTKKQIPENINPKTVENNFFQEPVAMPESQGVGQEIDQELFLRVTSQNTLEDFPSSYMDGYPMLPFNSGSTISANDIKNSGEAARVLPWLGSINSFYYTKGHTWMVDPDPLYGGSVDILAYCKRWYPETIMTRKYKIEEVKKYNINYELMNAPNSWSWECVQP